MTNETIIDDAPAGSNRLKTDILNLGQKSFAYMIGHLATRAISFLLLPLYTNMLAPADMGILSLAFTVSAFGLILFHFGFDSAIMRFYVGETKERQQQVLTTAYMTQLVIIFIFTSIFFSVRAPLAPILLGINRPDWLALIIFIIALDTVWVIPLHLFRAHEKPRLFVTFSLLNVTITMGLNILLVGKLHLGVEGALMTNLAASGIMFITTFPWVYRRLSLRAWDSPTLKALLKFGLPFMPAGLFTMTMEMSSRYMLRWLGDLETVGLFSAGYKLGMLMAILVMGFNMGWQPFYLRRGKQPDAEPVFARVATYFMALMGFVLLTGTAWVDMLVRLPLGGSATLLGPEYWSSTNIVPLVLLGYCGLGAYVLLLPGVHLLAKSKWVMLYRGAGAVATIALNLALIPPYGALGAAMAMTLSFFLMAVIAFTINQQFYYIPFEWSRLIRIALLATAGLLLYYKLQPSLMLSIGLTLLMPLGLLFGGALNAQERTWLMRKLHLK